MHAFIATVFHVSMTAIGVLSFAIVAVSIYLMYFDPESFRLAAENFKAITGSIEEARASRSITINF